MPKDTMIDHLLVQKNTDRSNHLLEKLIQLRELVSPNTRKETPHVHPNFQVSAKNLVNYLILRQHNLRELQLELVDLGLSSLSNVEANVMGSLNAVIDVLATLTKKQERWLGFTNGVNLGRDILNTNCKTLFGEGSLHRPVNIMVTMPTEASYDPKLVEDLLSQGMNCMRINCAHDSAKEWQQMIENLNLAKKSLGKECKVAMDLGGPKLRTGKVRNGPAVLKVQPKRDNLGKAISPGELYFYCDEQQLIEAEILGLVKEGKAVHVCEEWLSTISIGDDITLIDARQAHRRLKVTQLTRYVAKAETSKTLYLTPNIKLTLGASGYVTQISGINETPGCLRVYQNEKLCIHLNSIEAHTQQSPNEALATHHLSCTLPEAFSHAKLSDAIWIDDGKIGAHITEINAGAVKAVVTHCSAKGIKLKADKGINLPDTRIDTTSLTEKDMRDLAFIAKHADIVALSFVNTAKDVDLLLENLKKLSPTPPAIVLKIETQTGVENLADILLHAMRWHSVGVMIARGDLAVECGFERLAEVQEEILWICEAAHIPVIWATQVLENLAKKGAPSRAEITDAAMGHRAECVMLNKGPHIIQALNVLDDILTRMQAHQTKKRPMLRELRLAHASLTAN